jgi:hypothetical protein
MIHLLWYLCDNTFRSIERSSDFDSLYSRTRACLDPL